MHQQPTPASGVVDKACSMHSGPGATHDNLIYELPSVVNRIDLAVVFPKSQPLEVELGCGDSTFLVQYASRHPDRNFLGVERLYGRLRKLDRKGRRARLTNIRGIRIESSYFLRYLLPLHSAAAIHIYFADPWPKRKHLKNRLINGQFPNLARNALAPCGTVYLRTDNPDYFDQMQSAFGMHPDFSSAESPAELVMVPTDFEQEFQMQGCPILRAAYRLSSS